MSMLENIRRGRESKPPLILAYGVEGVGKSTFAAAAPTVDLPTPLLSVDEEAGRLALAAPRDVLKH